MNGETISLNRREQTRATVLNAVLDGGCATEEAAEMLGLSRRHVLRLKRAYRERGPAALAHGNRGRRPAHAISEAAAAAVVRLASDPAYAGYNHTHLHEVLTEQGVGLSLRSVSRVLRGAGLRSPRRHRPRRHRARRQRAARQGMLIQVDGSQHDWLEGRGPRLTLIGGVDDATGAIVGAVFREHEDAAGYFTLLRESVRAHGVPCAWYSDRHGVFQRNDKEPWTLAEELAGHRAPTQVGRALEALGIQRITARSPQAKGRVERCWQTLQDRLGKELRRAGACTLADANATLAAYLPRYNARFAITPADRTSAYQRLPRGVDLDSVCSFHYLRTVANDNTVRLEEHRIDIPPGPRRRSYAGCKVHVEERLDGSLVVVYRSVAIARQASAAAGSSPGARRRRATPDRSPLPPPARPRRPANPRGPAPTPPCNPPKPPATHPWRRALIQPGDKFTDRLR